MNKKLWIMILFATYILISCSQISSNDDMLDLYSNTEKVLISSENESSLSFEFTLFTKRKVKKFASLGLEGINVENLNIEMIDNTIDKIKNHKYKNYYTTVFMVTITPTEELIDEIEINKLSLNIDGEGIKVEFTTPIAHSFKGGNIFTHDFIPYIMPNDISSLVITSDSELIYQFEAKKDIQLENIYAKDYLTPTISMINIGGNIFDEKIPYPISIPANTMVEISLQFRGNEPTIDELNYISTNLFFEYTTNESSIKQTNEVVVFINPIYPILDDLNRVESYIDSFIYNK